MSDAIDLDARLSRPTVVFTLDVDWVDDETLSWAIRRFREYDLPVTVFATHATPVLEKPGEGLEVGIHPNLLGQTDHHSVVRELLAAYPAARGVRAHGLFEYANLMNVYRDLGLGWDCSQQLYLCPHLAPYRHPSGLVRLPMFWEDDDYIGLCPDWDAGRLGLKCPGVKCLDFHPIHLRLNSHSMEPYTHVKQAGFSRAAVERETHASGESGISVLLNRIIQFVRREGLHVATVGEVCAWV